MNKQQEWINKNPILWKLTLQIGNTISFTIKVIAVSYIYNLLFY